MSSHPNTQSATPIQQAGGSSRGLPHGNAGLWAFLGQMGVVAVASGLLGILATLAVYGLQLAGWLS